MLRIKFGNHKLGDDTAVINMGSAKDCPSKKLGLCSVDNDGIRCYARKAEETYPGVEPYRKEQEDYWKKYSAYKIGKDILTKISKRRKSTKYLRYNESGDFHTQADIDKLSAVAKSLKPLGIVTYGYTARSDLNFSNASFLVKGSGASNDSGNNGRTIVISKKETVPDNFIECPGSCKKCNICKCNVPHNVAFRKH
ncbi:MAG: hypothetical protein GY861_10305 [bacterium]|nr:hypothetical protein [bacterium]